MSILVGALKLVFLALVWLFIGVLAQVARADLFGGRAKGKNQRPGQQLASPPTAQPNPKRRGKRPRLAQLVVANGPGRGDAVPLAGEVLVGRAQDVTLDINDDFASGHHARFYRDDQSWIVADLGSRNGTIVNGLRITRPTRVGDGDIVRLGRTDITVEDP